METAAPRATIDVSIRHRFIVVLRPNHRRRLAGAPFNPMPDPFAEPGLSQILTATRVRRLR
jgi:hypothetical protein